MAGARDISEIICTTASKVLDAHPSASVQLRIARDVLGDDDLTNVALARGIPEDHPARKILRRVEFRESDVWMKTDVGGCARERHVRGKYQRTACNEWQEQSLSQRIA